MATMEQSPPQSPPQSPFQNAKDTTDNEDMTRIQFAVDVVEWWCQHALESETPQQMQSRVRQVHLELQKGLPVIASYGRLYNRLHILALAQELCAHVAVTNQEESSTDHDDSALSEYSSDDWNMIREQLILLKSFLLRKDANEYVLPGHTSTLQSPHRNDNLDHELSTCHVFQQDYQQVLSLLKMHQVVATFGEALQGLVLNRDSLRTKSPEKKTVSPLKRHAKSPQSLLLKKLELAVDQYKNDLSELNLEQETQRTLTSFLLHDLYSSHSQDDSIHCLPQKLSQDLRTVMRNHQDEQQQHGWAFLQAKLQDLLVKWCNTVLTKPTLVQLGYGESSKQMNRQDSNVSVSIWEDATQEMVEQEEVVLMTTHSTQTEELPEMILQGTQTEQDSPVMTQATTQTKPQEPTMTHAATTQTEQDTVSATTQTNQDTVSATTQTDQDTVSATTQTNQLDTRATATQTQERSVASQHEQRHLPLVETQVTRFDLPEKQNYDLREESHLASSSSAQPQESHVEDEEESRVESSQPMEEEEEEEEGLYTQPPEDVTPDTQSQEESVALLSHSTPVAAADGNAGEHTAEIASPRESQEVALDTMTTSPAETNEAAETRPSGTKRSLKSKTKSTRKRTRVVEWSSDSSDDDDDGHFLNGSTSNTPRARWSLSSTTSGTPRARRRFTLQEKQAIKAGVNRFGVGAWKEIKEFHDDVLRSRTSVNIKDCYRTMLNKGEVS